jgi:hypothetical protein
MRGHDEEPDGRLPELDELYREREPPPGLEDRVVRGLRADGSIGGRRAWSTRRPIAQAAAALLVFAAGIWVGRAGNAATATDGPMSSSAEADARYMLLLWEDETFAPSDAPEEVAAAYGAWAGTLAEQGVPIDGDELGLERALLGAATVRSNAGATVGGFFTVGAASLEDVRRLVEGHPHLANGGAIEIAPIVVR